MVGNGGQPERCNCEWGDDIAPERPCGCGQHEVRLYRDDAWHWRGLHWTSACLIAALTAQGETQPSSVAKMRAALKEVRTWTYDSITADEAERRRKFLEAAQGETAPASVISCVCGSCQHCREQRAAASPVPAAEGPTLLNSDDRAKLFAIADELNALHATVAAEGLDVKTLARETTEQVAACRSRFTGFDDDKAEAIILAALRAVAEGRR